MQTTKPRTHADLAARLTRDLSDNPGLWISYDVALDFSLVYPQPPTLTGMMVFDLTYHPDRADNVRTMIQHALDAILSPHDNSNLKIYIRHYAYTHNLTIWTVNS